MARNTFTRLAVIGAILLLLVSAGLNVYLYQQGRDYYLQLNAVRLDPLGVSAYPTNSPQAVNLTHKPLVVFFGDSRAAGWITSTLPADLTIINRGIGAQTTAQVLGRFPYHISLLKPDVVVLQVGINDLKTIPLFPDQEATIIANCKANIQQIVELSRQSGAEVILTTVFPLGKIPLERRPFWSDDVALAIKDVNHFIATLAGDKVKIFDAASILSDGQDTLNPAYSQDFLHLNDQGYVVLNQQLIRILYP
jgi:lysophospholipase L1-like esterase